MFTPRPRFGEQTPPAIFPPVLGLFGLGLAWRRAGDVPGAPAFLGEMVLGAVTLLFLFCAFAYGRKVARRAGVVAEDLRVLPGRAGLSALVLSVYLSAAALAPLARPLAEGVLWAGFALHAGLVVLVVRALLTGPAEARTVTPVWHLQFVGFIVGAVAALALGRVGVAAAILPVTAGLAVLIWGASLVQLIRRDVPAPLRPLLAIHVAPASLLGTVAAGVGNWTLAYVFAALALGLVVALLARLRWLIAAGFSPLWGAFTFPMAAFAGMLLALGQGPVAAPVFAVAGGGALVAASLAIPAIAVKVMQAWARGGLGPKTNAARA
ncbi:tellurium resistance protein [Rhodovulum adriaticum]|uniref:Tellurite resistance protein n=1 Tax=Rhodovulum adriaticum TaxID=35804 RepID=A0A4R2NY55_RHOAD|nr:tellurium resistance protein [Rhodovulum adriaticum]TCP26471.1 tellurite resistance protein [Rhodovulum adriaticum]